jgi:hypothetical protein
MKKILSFALSFLLLAGSVWAGDTTSNGYFYLPSYGASGAAERTSWYSSLEATDAVLDSLATTQTNLNAINGILTVDGSGGFSADTSVGNLITLTGMSEGSTNFGTFNGNIIADSSTMKGALDDLETSLSIWFNIVDFGGDSSGIADSSTAFEETRTAAKAAGGGILFPPGTYTTTSTFTFDVPVLGLGMPRIKSIGDIPSVIVSGSYITVDGLKIYPDGTGSTLNDCIQVAGGARTRIENVITQYCKNDGIRFDSTSASNNLAVLNNVVSILNDGDGIEVNGGDNNNGITFSNIDARGNGGNGILIDGSSGIVAANVFSNVAVQNNTGYGLYFKGADCRNNIGTVYLESNTGGDLYFDADAHSNMIWLSNDGTTRTDANGTNTILFSQSGATQRFTFDKMDFNTLRVINTDYVGYLTLDHTADREYEIGHNGSSSAGLLTLAKNAGSTFNLVVEGLIQATTLDTGYGPKELGDAAIADGDTTTIPNSDQIYDFCETTQAYLQSDDALNGEVITDDTIDDDSIDFGVGADQISGIDIPLDVTNFGGILGPTDTNTQAALETIDDYVAGSGDMTKAEYDTDDDGVVDAVNADGINWATLQLIDSSSTSIQLSQAQSSSMVLDQDGVHVGKKLYVGLAAGETSSMQFLEDPDNGTNYIAIHPPSSLTSNYDLTFPEETGTIVSNQSSAVNEKFFSGTILDPAEGDSAQISSNDDYAITLNSFKCQVAQGSTSVPYTLYECTNPTTCTIVKTQFTCSTGGISFTAFDDSSIASSSSLIMGGGAPTGSPEAIFFSGKYTITR